MGTLDLDAARAARAEAKQENHVVVFGGEKFELPPEPPWEMVELPAMGDAPGGVRALLGDEQYIAFKRHRPSVPDMVALLEGAVGLYGLTVGESSASAGSS